MPRKTSSVLLIDDEKLVRESIAAYLEDSGFEVHQAENGELGLALYKDVNPDVVLCDLRMPVLGGMQVLEQIHAEDKDAAVIVVSGIGVMSDVVDALRLGACDYLIKPIVDMQVLEHSINRSLEQSRLKQENLAYKEALEDANKKLSASLDILRQDQQAGRHIQLGMMPETPYSCAHYTFEHHILPSLYLSGDFADYFVGPHGEIVFCMADVSGHGSSSAFVTALLKNMTSRFRRRLEADDELRADPALLLKGINTELLDSKIGKHCTNFIAVINPEKNQLTYACASHFPPPLIFADGKVTSIDVKGSLPLGLFPNLEYENYTLELAEDFAMVLFSDGILEILPQPDLDAKQDFLLQLVGESDGDLATIINRLELESYSEVPDDIAVLTVKRV